MDRSFKLLEARTPTGSKMKRDLDPTLAEGEPVKSPRLANSNDVINLL